MAKTNDGFGEYKVLVRNADGNWEVYCRCWSWVDAIREAEFLRRYEGREAKAE